MGGCVRTGFGGRDRPYGVAAFRPESVAPFDRNTHPYPPDVRHDQRGPIDLDRPRPTENTAMRLRSGITGG
jgi:hypothetical protein